MPQFCNRVASWDCVKNIREMEGRPRLAISERFAFNRFSFSRADVRRHRLAPAAGSRARYRFASRKSTHGPAFPARPADRPTIAAQDRKSTRLNSSHVKISYAVFCLKKKSDSVSDLTADDSNERHYALV